MKVFSNLTLIATLAFTGNVFASSSFPGYIDTSAKNLYGATAGYSGSCTACHGNSAPSLPNKFGTDFKAQFMSLGYSLSLTQAQVQNVIKGMENLDSDSDGATNKAELTANTNPGDPNSKPAPAPVCTPAAPTLTLDAASKTGAPGDALNFTASLKNNDSSACANATFALSGSAPSGFTISLAMQSVVLAPGASSNVIVSVKSPAAQADGNYGFSVSSSDAAQALHAKSVSGTYVVKAVAAPVCTRNAPSVSLSPVTQSGPAGSSLTYKLNVLNNDTAACANSTLQIAANGSAPLSITPSANSLSLAPGQSGSVNLVVKSDAGTKAGTYAFKGLVSDSAVAQHAGSVDGQYMVTDSNSADVTPPTAPANLVVKAHKRRAFLMWGASSDNVGVVKYIILVDGKPVAESVATKAGVRLPSGAHEISVKAQDAAGNLSMASNVVKVDSQAKVDHRGQHVQGQDQDQDQD